MRVLCLTNFYPTPERPSWGTFVKSQMESLRPGGVEFDVVLIRGWEDRLNYWRQRSEVSAALRRDYDLVHVHFGLTGVLLEGMRPPATVVSLCGDDLLGRSRTDGRIALGSLPMVWLSRRAAARADAVIVKSERMRQAFHSTGECEVIPNGVDLSFFSPVPRAEARSRLGWPAHEPTVLFAADPATAAKNFPLAEAVMRRLLLDGIAARLVTFFGRPQEDLALAMNASDALIFPSWWEGSPNVVKEAMAVGLPVVSVDVGDVKEYVEGCEGCSVVDRTPEAMAAALGPLLHSSRRSGGRARMESLRMERVAERVLGVYRRAMEKHAGSR